MAANMNPTTWDAFCTSDKEDDGAVKALFDLTDQALTSVSPTKATPTIGTNSLPHCPWK
jgi:hypothetical protein